jgi:hypothetical protein
MANVTSVKIEIEADKWTIAAHMSDGEILKGTMTRCEKGFKADKGFGLDERLSEEMFEAVDDLSFRLMDVANAIS